MEPFKSLEIVVNGVAENSPPGCVADLVVRKGLASRALVVVLNEQCIRRDQWPAVQLRAGDRLELLTLVAGG